MPIFPVRGSSCQARIQDLNAQGLTPKIFIVGRKGFQALTTRLPADKYTYNYTEDAPMGWQIMEDPRIPEVKPG